MVLIVASYFCYNALGSDLLPAMDEGGFILDYLMPAGSSLADTNEVLLGVEKILAKHAGSGKHIAPHRAAAGAGSRDGSEHGRFLRQAEETSAARTIDEVISAVRDKVNDEYPQLDVEFVADRCRTMIGDLSNSPEPIEIKLFSQDPGLLRNGRRRWATGSRKSKR